MMSHKRQLHGLKIKKVYFIKIVISSLDSSRHFLGVLPLACHLNVALSQY